MANVFGHIRVLVLVHPIGAEVRDLKPQCQPFEEKSEDHQSHSFSGDQKCLVKIFMTIRPAVIGIFQCGS